MATKGMYSHGHGELRYCPRCGGGRPSGGCSKPQPQRLVCGVCSFIFYLDPKVVAGTLFTIDGRVVLLRRGVRSLSGSGYSPAGAWIGKA
jgi:ADP-ribose pyrophosphatase